MPKRTDIKNILIIGSGPIVIGQGCEFDYSGTQACKALREEGYGVVLINSNPATIMTDPDIADRTYVEPITPEFVEKVLEQEASDGRSIDALLPTLGGQTGLNCAMDVAEQGILARHSVRMIGATREAIHQAEDRSAFKQAMLDIGLDVPRSDTARSWDSAKRVLARIGLPCCIRPAYTLGGEGGGFARTFEQFEQTARRGLKTSRVNEILIEEDLFGWKEFELELMRDGADNAVVICSIENIDPLGVHTGDSITVAPAQTLTDKEYQKMRDSAIAVMRAIGVDTGGCNIQFGVDPTTGRQVVIEMNPRVSRSSALASKATGYPIARIAAKLAVGYTLDELKNDITGSTPASFEPTLDYVVVKMPRWTFEKFPDCDETLTTVMKSVGEGMAIGRTFKEALQKCIRSMEIQRFGFGLDKNDASLDQTAPPTTTTLSPKSRADALLSATTTDEGDSRGGQRSSSSDRNGESNEEQGESFLSLSQSTKALPGTLEEAGELRLTEHRTNASVSSLIGGATATEAPSDTEETHARAWPLPVAVLRDKLTRPCQGRLYYIRYALKMGWSVAQIHELTRIDPWFLEQLSTLVLSEPSERECDSLLRTTNREAGDRLVGLKRMGYSDVQIAAALGRRVDKVAAVTSARGARPTYKLVDTCAAEFDAVTPYFYSAHEAGMARIDKPGTSVFDDEIRVTDRPKIVVLGGGPNRIGQGIEFDYCCCHASFAARDAGYESVMINSNPETVSTDYDTSDMLFFEPLTHEDVLNVLSRLNGPALVPRAAARRDTPDTDGRAVKPNGHVRGAVVQFGGQTPLNLAQGLKDAGVPILGTQPEMIHLAEDRDAFQRVLRALSLLQPPNGIARSADEAVDIASRIGFPVLVRPSYVLGGRGMKVCNTESDLTDFLRGAFDASDRSAVDADNPVLIDKFLVDAIEIDVDAVADFGRCDWDIKTGEAMPHDERAKPMCLVAGIMEHIEEAGIHSGDSTCVLPPFSLGRMTIEEVFRSTRRLAERLCVCGVMNVQYAILNRTVYVLEVNPRASRTLPFVAKATGVPWARIATRVMLGEPLADVLSAYGISETPRPEHTAIKAPVFPFDRFAGTDVILGPEMRSTGEAMSIDSSFGRAFAKAQIATGLSLPTHGNVLVSVRDEDKPRIVSIARDLYDMGFSVFSTTGTRNVLAEAGIPSTLVSKSTETGAPFLKDLIDNGTLALLINTPIHTGPASAEGRWRSAAFLQRLPLITTIAGARAAVAGIRALREDEHGEIALPLGVRSLQAHHDRVQRGVLRTASRSIALPDACVRHGASEDSSAAPQSTRQMRS